MSRLARGTQIATVCAAQFRHRIVAFLAKFRAVTWFVSAIFFCLPYFIVTLPIQQLHFLRAIFLTHNLGKLKAGRPAPRFILLSRLAWSAGFWKFPPAPRYIIQSFAARSEAVGLK